jgi:hypothetical protein
MPTAKKYGVHLNIHPAATQKRVTIHRLPCSHYKQHSGTSKGTYTFNKDCEDLSTAIDRASLYAREWNTPIRTCKTCFDKNIQTAGA